MTQSIDETSKSIKGSFYWMAPELLKQEGHSRKIDVWSLGCCLIEMATGQNPWKKECKTFPELLVRLAQKQSPPIPQHLSPEAQDFIASCCTFDAKLRPRVRELRQHVFILQAPSPNKVHEAALQPSLKD
jgi:serine/threonine protein kinase